MTYVPEMPAVAGSVSTRASRPPGDVGRPRDAASPRSFSPAENREIEALRARDPEAVERLVRRYGNSLYWFILRRVHDPDETLSLVQETFLQALRSLPTFEGRARLSTWLYSIATHVAMGYLRKAQRCRVLTEEEIDRLQPRFVKGRAHAAHYPAWNPEKFVEQQERIRLVRQALDRLPERYRAVVVLRDLKENSTAETAQALGISEANVRVRLHRAHNALRKLLEPHYAVTLAAAPAI